MEWVQMVVVPVLIAIVPCVLTYLGTRAQIKADLTKNKSQLDMQAEKNHQEILQAIKQHNKEQDEALKCLLRTELLNMYFKHVEKNNKTLNQWEAENMHKMFNSYAALDGNSFVQDLVDRMNSWEVLKN